MNRYRLTCWGVIGLGGAEFPLPVLAGPLGYPSRRAVPLNLVTLAAALAIRGRTLPPGATLHYPWTPLPPFPSSSTR
jgi:hypothetical protein